MKLVTLNLWGGRIKGAYSDFFKKYHDVDTWFFQEIYAKKGEEYHVSTPGYHIDFSLLENLSSYIPNHEAHFCQVLRSYYGIASFVQKDIKVIEKGEIFIARGDWDDMSVPHERDHNRKLQWLEVLIHGKKMLLMNAHCTHRPEGKRDSKKRLNQSAAIIHFMNMFDCPKILVGDFNLLPDTESIRMIEAIGMRNLVTEYNVQSTRTELYKKPLQFADYIFVSSGIKVNDFKVLPDVVSDHSPLFLDFELE